MGYTRSGGVHYIGYSGSVSVSYPASQHGGSTTASYSGQVAVSVQVYVDSDPVERSLQACKNHIDVLTGSVVATEAAQISAIHENSKKIAHSFTDGFFNIIRSELTQRMTESRSVADSRLMKLTEMAVAIQQKSEQMRQDFNRIAERYGRLFDDLDRETYNRVRALDQAAFDMSDHLGEQAARPMASSLSSTAVLSGGEQTATANTMAAAGVRLGAHALLRSVMAYLSGHQQLGQTLSRLLQPVTVSGKTGHYLPILYVASDGPAQDAGERIYSSAAAYPGLQPDRLAGDGAAFRNSYAWQAMDADVKEKIGNHLVALISETQPASGAQAGHAERVARQIWELWQKNPPQALAPSPR